MTTPSFLSSVAVWALVLLAPHLLGGATPEMTWFITIGALLASASVWVYAYELERKSFVVPCLGVALVLQAATVLQGLPLPCGLVGLLAPKSASVQQAAAALTQWQSAAFCTLSYDHGATWRALGWTSTVLCSLLAFSLFVQLGGRQSLLTAVAASCGIVAISALSHRLGGLSSLYGIYEPIYAHGRTLGPFLNENHLGAFIALGVPLMVGLGMGGEERTYNILWFGLAALSAGTSVLTLSRGAFAMLLFELVMLGVFVAFRRRKETGPRRVLAVLAAGGLALGIFAAGEQLLGEFEAGGAGKIEQIASAFRYTFSVPLWGVGRGAFGAAFTSVFGHTSRPEFVENLPIQWAADWGWPIALAALATLGWWIARALLAFSSILQVAGVISLIALFLQNMVDFNVEMPGMAVVAVALLVGVVIPSRDQMEMHFWLERRFGRRVPLKRCLMALGGGVMGTVISVWAGVSDSSFEDLYRRVQSRAGSQELLSSIKRAVTRHPGDARFALLGASVSNAISDPDAAHWIAFSRRLAPGWGGPFVVQAHRALLRGDLRSSFESVRDALARDPDSAPELVCTVAARWSETGESLDDLIPQGAAAAPVADRVARCESLSPEARFALDDLALRRVPDAWQIRLRMARRPGVQPGEVVSILKPMADRHHAEALAYAGLADAYDAMGKPRQAYKALEQGLRHTNQPHLLQYSLARRFGRDHRIDQMRAALETMRADAIGDPRVLADAYERAGGVEVAFGDPRLAMGFFEKAYRLVPRKELLVWLLDLATRQGDAVKVMWVRAALCRQGESTYCVQPPSLLSGAAP